MSKIPLTLNGAQQLKDELQRLKTVDRPAVIAAIAEARSHPGPVLLDFVVEQEVNVYPMVAPGKALNEMWRRPVSAPAAAA
jgi:thiamine pyrophosphate-dependent acetolactate synthase large subunit-like protein